MSNVFFGIDIGTGNCSVAYVVDDPRQRNQQLVDVRTVSVAVDDSEVGESNRMPSVVARDWTTAKSTRLLFGFEFQRGFFKKRRSGKLLRRGVDYFSSVKSDMGTNKVYPRSAIDGMQTPCQVTAFILKRLAEAVSARNPKHDIRKSFVTVSVPASFSALAREETLEALVRAGFDRSRVELIDEPVAALLDLLNSSDVAHVLSSDFRNVLVFDYGAGTCDLSVVKARFNAQTASGLEVINLAVSPYRQLGGDDVDRAVMQQVVWPLVATGQERTRISAADERRIEDTLTTTVARTLKERMCRKVAAESRNGRESLTSSSLIETCTLGSQFDVSALEKQTPAQFKMTAKQFADVMAPFLAVPSNRRDALRSLLGPVFETLARAELKPHDLDVIVLHGGSSQNPYVEMMLRERIAARRDLFGEVDVVSTPDRVASVARGAALSTYWRRARSVEIVRPIIADDLGIMVIDGSRKCLLRAGDTLPYPAEDEIAEVTTDEFVVPADGLPELLIPIYTGRGGGSSSVAGTIKVPIPAGTHAGAPVRIKLNVNRDKILNWWFSINGGPFHKAASVNDPWSLKAPSPRERELMEHRRQIRARLEEDRVISAAELVSEANMLRRAGCLDEAFTAIDDVLDDHPDFAEALNLKGLIHSDAGDGDAAADFFRRAAEARGSCAVYVANYGAQLVDNGKLAPGIAQLRRAIADDFRLPYAYECLAQALRAQGDEEGAQRELRQGVKVAQERIDEEPLDHRWWIAMSTLRRMLGEYEQAEAALRAAREIDRNQFYGGDSSAIIASRHGKRSWQDTSA